TVLGVRLAFWSQTNPWRAIVAACDESIAFLTGVALAFLSHLIQNVLYFSSGLMAVRDLLGSVFIRVNNSDETVPTLATRWQLLQQLASVYVHLFSLPQWSHWRSLAAATAVAVSGGVVAARRLHGTRRVAVPLALVTCVALGSLVAWWVIAPGHAIPHPHFFPRMLFVPLLVVLAGAVGVFAASPSPTGVAWRVWRRHILTQSA